LNKTINLTQNPVYAFNAASADDVWRFTLTFGSVGINTPAGKQPLVYNANGLVYLRNLTGASDVTLLSITGQVMRRLTAEAGTDFSFSTSGLTPGMYLVQVRSAQGSSTAKVVITR